MVLSIKQLSGLLHHPLPLTSLSENKTSKYNWTDSQPGKDDKRYLNVRKPKIKEITENIF